MHFSITDLPVPEPPMTTSEWPFGTDSVDAVQHMLRPEALAARRRVRCVPRPSRQSANSSEVRAKLAARIRIAEETTALVVARPTPCAPPLELKPW